MSSPEAALQSMMQNLEKQTGKSFDEWIKIVRASNLTKARQITDFLKAEHGLTFGYANMIALKALGSDAGSSNADDLLALQRFILFDAVPVRKPLKRLHANSAS